MASIRSKPTDGTLTPLVSGEPTVRLRDADASDYPTGYLLMVSDLGRLVPAEIVVTRGQQGEIEAIEVQLLGK